MYKKARLLGAALLMACSVAAQAEVIVGSNSSTDTDQNLVFLHVGQTSAMDDTTAQAGISFDGYNWVLATAEEFLALVEGAAGISIPAWDGSNLGDFDMTSAEALLMMAALDGDGNTGVLPGFWVDGESFGISQVYAHTGNDDFHLEQGPQWGTSVPALFVRALDEEIIDTTPVPTLTQWGLILLTLMLLGLASATLRSREKI